MKSVAAANSAVVPTSRKLVALYHRNTKIWMLSDERDYSGSSPNGHSRKRTAIITATFTKPSRMNGVSALEGLNLERV